MKIFIHLILIIAIWTLVGLATAYFARQRGRDPYIWFAIGVCFGVLGLLLLILLPSVSEGETRPQDDQTPQPPVIIEAAPAEAACHHDYLIKEWFCIDKAHQNLGPMHFNLLKTLWKDGKVDSHTFVWCEGMPEWKRIENLSDVHEVLGKEDER
jgi:hypothetical protein